MQAFEENPENLSRFHQFPQKATIPPSAKARTWE
jgi:hypothetical protein